MSRPLNSPLRRPGTSFGVFPKRCSAPGALRGVQIKRVSARPAAGAPGGEAASSAPGSCRSRRGDELGLQQQWEPRLR